MFVAADPREAEAFLAAHPETETVDLLIADLNGIFRGKQVAPAGLGEVFAGGVRLPGSIFSGDVTGASVAEAGLVWEIGDADQACVVVPGSLAPVPWRKAPGAQLLMTMEGQAGGPYFADPRQALAGVVETLARDGLHPVVAFELEFYLLDRQTAPDGGPRPPRSPRTGRRQRGVQVYGMAELDEFEDLFRDLAAGAEAQGLPIDMTIAEYAPGQYETNLHHGADPLRAADQALLLKRLVRGVAQAHGYDATFLSKPFADQAGNGMHLHVSLCDEAGSNIFASEAKEGSAALRHGIGGLGATMVESMAIFAANPNAFRRFQAGSYAPLSPSWGYDNRTVAFRIPFGPSESRRVEHRLSGADANPYLVLAAILAGLHHGIVRKIDPGERTVGNAYEQHGTTVPTRWEDALDALADGEILPRYIDPDLLRVYRTTKESERRSFLREVPPAERALFLRAV
ncbi:MAG: glutamine synthetase [Rhodospirillaceae bacterium]|jgi:glutamine synthetase|nr:glutamine synthetase [Rhodospirillaceae bacterium]MBT6116358.1 glutamine synthetase [Rhodospirillaceae bacterium]